MINWMMISGWRTGCRLLRPALFPNVEASSKLYCSAVFWSTCFYPAVLVQRVQRSSMVDGSALLAGERKYL